MTRRAADPKELVTLRLRRSTFERLKRSATWRIDLQEDLEERYGDPVLRELLYARPETNPNPAA